MPATAVLSAIVVTPDSCRSVLPLLRRLRAQTLAHRMEIVFVVPEQAELDPEVELLSAFACWKRTPVKRLESMASARAVGVRAASCPFVVFTEQHSFPEEHWAAAIVGAFEAQGADAVGPVLGNANPALALSWLNLCIEYGQWMAPHAGGPAGHIPGHNSAYRRDRLMALGEGLPEALESEFALHRKWHAEGLKLWLEPKAVTRHVSITRLAPHLYAACCFQRPWARSRAKSWGWPRRLAYALAWPCIAAVRLPRVIRDLRRIGRAGILPRVLPHLLLNLLASAFGEFLGYLGSVGNSNAVLLEVELYRHRFLSPRDVSGLALFR